MSKIKSTVICDFPVSNRSFSDNYNFIVEKLKEKQGQWIVTLNLEMIYFSQKDEQYKALLKSADFFMADGVPLQWVSKLKKNQPQIAERSNGTDLVEKLLTAGFRTGVIGGENPKLAVKNYNSNLLTEAFIYDGEVNLNNNKFVDELAAKIRSHKTELLFLNLGTPKQDILADKIREQINSITIIGVGGSFDILAGLKPRAPKWMQKNGLEWFFRLIIEPKRLAKRYLIHYPQAVFYLIKDFFNSRLEGFALLI